MKRWTFLTAILIANFFLVINGFSQGHFVLSYTGNGQDHMNINIVEALIGGVALETGDEIAAFDGTICCGMVILQQPIVISNPSTFISITASKADVGLSNGFTANDPITIKFWDSSKRREMSGITATFINTSGTIITAPSYTVGASAFVKLSVAALPNQIPVSNAGIDQSVNEGISVTLNGSGSSDPDYDALKYTWTAPAGITLSSTTATKPTFTAPQVSVNTNYTFSLIVNDGLVNSLADQIVVTVKQVNKVPIANAGIDQSINEGAIVTLDGSVSADPDGNVLTYSWTAPAGITLSSTTSAKPTFTAPPVSVNTNYTFSLVVNDGTVNSLIDQIIVTVIPLNLQSITKTLGNTDVYVSTLSMSDRRAMPVTFTENGSIQSISIYHNGGTGNVLLGVYSDQSGLPSSKLGVTTSTLVNTTAGWQTVTLINPVNVTAGQTLWLGWVFQNSTGVRYTAGTPGRAQSTATWSSGLPATFGTATTAGNKFSIYCTYKPTLVILGNNQIYSGVLTSTYRRAMPYTISEAGAIQSISIYHDGGTGNVLLGVYSDLNGLPDTKLGETGSTVVNSTAGWQTVSLTSPVTVTSGQTIWLGWVFQNNTGVRYMAGTPGRAQSNLTWSSGMPATFGTSSTAGNKFSIYCTYIQGASVLIKSADIALHIEDPSNTSSELSIYPNPTTGEVHLMFNNTPEANSWITVYNSIGSLISKTQVEGQEQTLQLKGNPPGIYLIKINQKDSKTYKVILQ